MAGTTAALIAVQGVPVLDVLVDAGIAGVAVYALGSEAIGVIKDLAGFASGVVNAKTEADLDAAWQQMARAVSTVGVDAVAAVLLHKAGGTMKENMPPSSAMRWMVTPEGVRVRALVEDSPARANMAKITAEGESSSSTPPLIQKVKVGHIELPATTEMSVKDKLYGYLLNPSHSEGGSKARWFKEALGFTRENMNDLSKQMIFDEFKAVKTATTPHGSKFNQTINITGMNGKKIDVLFGWIRNNDGVVRLIIAIPSKK